MTSAQMPPLQVSLAMQKRKGAVIAAEVVVGSSKLVEKKADFGGV